MGKVFKQLRAVDWVLIGLSLGLIVLQVWLELLMPDYTRTIIEAVTDKENIVTMKDVLIPGGYMLLCAAGSMGSGIIVCWFSAIIAAGLGSNLRAALFGKVQNFSMEEINKFSTASLITRSTNDVTQVQMLVVMGLQILIKAPIMAIWAIVKISSKSWQWTAATAVTVGVLLVWVVIMIIMVMPKFKKIQSYTDNLNRITRENLQGVRVVRAYNAESYQERKFDVANKDLTKTQTFTMRAMSFLMPGMNLLMNGLNLAVYWLGAYIVNGGASIAERKALFADMAVFSSYAMLVVMSFVMLTMIFIMLPRSLVSAKRIAEVLSTETHITGGIGAPVTEVRGEIEFKNVTFRYPDAAEDVIANVSFKAKRGDTVAFIGSTGSGKSTLINLVPRFYDATEGEVLIDGVNVKDYKFDQLYDKIGYVPQRAVLFSGTIASNVTYGEDSRGERTKEQIKKAIEVAQGGEFVDRMGGLDADIAQGGTNISGGQKQRLAIARAVCREPEVYIFDDSFSALDYKTDKVLRAALKQETSDATCLIVAQRIGTIIDADQILVLEEGKVVGQGTHKELLQNCSVYQEIAYSQLSKEELNRG